MTQQILMVVLVFSLLAALLWLLRNKGMAAFSAAGRGRRSARRLLALERLALTPHHSLHLVRVAGRVLLISSSPNSCNLVESWPLNDLDLSAPGASEHAGASR